MEERGATVRPTRSTRALCMVPTDTVSLGVTHSFDRNFVPETDQNVYQLDSAGVPVPCRGSERTGGCRVRPGLVGRGRYSVDHAVSERRGCGQHRARNMGGIRSFSLVVTYV